MKYTLIIAWIFFFCHVKTINVLYFTGNLCDRLIKNGAAFFLTEKNLKCAHASGFQLAKYITIKSNKKTSHLEFVSTNFACWRLLFMLFFIGYLKIHQISRREHQV